MSTLKHIKYVFYRSICDVFSGSGIKLLVGVEFLSFLRQWEIVQMKQTSDLPCSSVMNK